MFQEALDAILGHLARNRIYKPRKSMYILLLKILNIKFNNIFCEKRIDHSYSHEFKQSFFIRNLKF